MDTTRLYTQADDAVLRRNEKLLRDREGKRSIDVVQGRADNRTQVCHYLVIQRPDTSFAVDPTEIEPYRDFERAAAVAWDCETGARRAKCRGGFKLTYLDGKIVGAEVLDLSGATMPVYPDRTRNILVEGE